MATLPDQIKTEDDLVQFFQCLGNQYHPDSSYIDQLSKKERETLDDDSQCELAAKVDSLRDQAFTLFGDRVYTIGLKEQNS